MFFIGIFGIQDQIKEVRRYPNTICHCVEGTDAVLLEESTFFHIFFIPLWKWNVHYTIEVRCCSRVFTVPDHYVEELKKSSVIDFEKLIEIKRENMEDYCPYCGRSIEANFRFCPYCGKQF